MLQDKTPPSGVPDDNIFRDDSGSDQGLAAQLLDALEPGVIFWSKSGLCMMRNRHAFDLLELNVASWTAEPTLNDFLSRILERGDLGETGDVALTRLFQAGAPFSYEHNLPSGRVVAAKVRPMRAGGHIACYTDMTDRRDAIAALETAQRDADIAQRQAEAVLADERKRQREGQHLSNLDEWLQSCQTLAELYRVVRAFMTLVLPATRGQFFVYDEDRELLEEVCAWPSSDAPVQHITPECCWALRRGRRYFYDKNQLGFLCGHMVDQNGPDVAPPQSLCLPIQAHGDTVGLLHLVFEAADANPDVLDAPAFATRCGERISLAIANVRLRDKLQDRSDRDPLTGLFNRRVFGESLARAMVEAGSRESSMALLAVDADKFKPFNDNYGHDAGDAILQALADQLRAIDYPDATPCRIGGEEFAVVLPTADRTRAGKVAEALRAAIEAMKVKQGGQILPTVTVSIGIAIFPTHGTEAEDLIKQADMALYLAKDAGRNNWKVADSDGMISFE